MTDFADPILRFQDALARAKSATPFAAGPAAIASADPTAMTLATIGAEGRPAARIVLLKSVDARGFVFHTNRQSRKGHDLAAHPQAALLFLWPALAEQVRIEGDVELLSDDESDAYFATRPRDSQIGAWASLQSETLARRDDLAVRVREVEARFAGGPVPRPPHWGGYRVKPLRIEFWREVQFRLHERDAYERAHLDAPWAVRFLYP